MEKQILSKSQAALFSQGISETQGGQYDVLVEAFLRASRYLAGVNERPVFPAPDALARARELNSL
jgi:hypothetical protein